MVSLGGLKAAAYPRTHRPLDPQKSPPGHLIKPGLIGKWQVEIRTTTTLVSDLGLPARGDPPHHLPCCSSGHGVTSISQECFDPQPGAPTLVCSFSASWLLPLAAPRRGSGCCEQCQEVTLFSSPGDLLIVWLACGLAVWFQPFTPWPSSWGLSLGLGGGGKPQPSHSP